MNKYWTDILQSIKSPLHFFSLSILIVGIGMLGAAPTLEDNDKPWIFFMVGGILVFAFIVVAAISIFKPDVLTPKNQQPVSEKWFAEALGNDIFTAFDGYLSNDLPSRGEAYQQFREIMASSSYARSQDTKEFTAILIDTVVNKAAVTGKREYVKGVLHT